VSVVGVLPGPARQAGDGAAVDANPPAGLARAVAFGEVVDDRTGLLLGEVRVEQRGALALGEAVFAGSIVEEADGPLLAEVAADGEVSGVAAAVERTVGILAAEASEVRHRSERIGRCLGDGVRK